MELGERSLTLTSRTSGSAAPEGSSTPSPYRDWLRVLAHKATNDRNKLLTILLNRLKYILFNNAKGLFCVTQVECSSNNVIRLSRNFPTSLGVVSVMQLRMFKFREDKSNNVFREILKYFRKNAKFEFFAKQIIYLESPDHPLQNDI